VVTIFVNPTQFGPGEDLAQYPRELERDLEKLAERSIDSVFAPSQDEMYSDRHATMVHPHPIAKKLEGLCRPGHFSGVATIVLKLLNVIPADSAYFGSKDYQQYLVIEKMVEDLNLPVDIVACPIFRESDGLAMSSRNRYLSSAEREQALAISQSLALADDLASEEEPAGRIAANIRQHLATAGIRRIDYVAVVDPKTLDDVKQINEPALVAIAAYVGETRLIDNRLICALD
jgi:pantoate--beta-alanine ligase